MAAKREAGAKGKRARAARKEELRRRREILDVLLKILRRS
jgi:hypothetical protein